MEAANEIYIRNLEMLMKALLNKSIYNDIDCKISKIIILNKELQLLKEIKTDFNKLQQECILNLRYYLRYKLELNSAFGFCFEKSPSCVRFYNSNTDEDNIKYLNLLVDIVNTKSSEITESIYNDFKQKLKKIDNDREIADVKKFNEYF